MLEEKKYDLVLMDVQMPVMDGLEATGRIREKEKITGEHIRIIALTAGATVFDIQKCLDAGMDKHISKPVKAAKLFDLSLLQILKNCLS
jgi:CheY-like chemotaxis protein